MPLFLNAQSIPRIAFFFGSASLALLVCVPVPASSLPVSYLVSSDCFVSSYIEVMSSLTAAGLRLDLALALATGTVSRVGNASATEGTSLVVAVEMISRVGSELDTASIDFLVLVFLTGVAGSI